MRVIIHLYLLLTRKLGRKNKVHYSITINQLSNGLCVHTRTQKGTYKK